MIVKRKKTYWLWTCRLYFYGQVMDR